MIKWLRCILFFVLLLSSSACAATKQSDINLERSSVSEFITQFPATFLPMLQDAHKRFLETEQKLDCFQVNILEESEIISITYIPKPDVKVFSDGRISTSRTESSCGRAISFEYKPTGEFIRQYFNR